MYRTVKHVAEGAQLSPASLSRSCSSLYGSRGHVLNVVEGHKEHRGVDALKSKEEIKTMGQL